MSEPTKPEEKRSFVLYYSLAEVVALLNDTQVANLFRAILSTGSSMEMPELDAATQIAFLPVRREIEENTRRWEIARQARIENGKRGGRPPKNADQRKSGDENRAKPAGFSENRTKPVDVDVAVDGTGDVDVAGDGVIPDLVEDEDPSSSCSADAERLCGSSSSQESASSAFSEREVNDHFTALWALMPRKEGKSAVKPATRRALMSVGVEEMRRCVERYKAQVAEDRETGFERKWMLGSTWFNSERWRDYTDENYHAPEPLPAVKTPVRPSVRAQQTQYRSAEEEARNRAYYASVEE